MGLAAIDDALHALHDGRPVIVSGVGEDVLGVVIWAAVSPPSATLEHSIGAVDVADPSRSVIVARTAAGVAGDFARLLSGTLLHWSELSEVKGPAPAHSVSARVADDHGLAQVDASDLFHHLWKHELLVERVASARLPMRSVAFTAHVYGDRFDTAEHIALVYGEPTSSPLVRVHSECVTGDIFGSERCDCGAQLDQALDLIVEEGHGIVVYLRDHEGRGIGLGEKLRAYRLQDEGLDTVEANEALGHPIDARHYGAASQILRDLGAPPIRLMTNNPRKVADLRELGIEIESRVPLEIEPNRENRGYLEAKRTKLGHLFERS